MITVLKAIYTGLKTFFSILYTVVTFIPRAFSALWRFFGYVKDFVGFVPVELQALAGIVIVCAVVYLILGR